MFGIFLFIIYLYSKSLFKNTYFRTVSRSVSDTESSGFWLSNFAVTSFTVSLWERVLLWILCQVFAPGPSSLSLSSSALPPPRSLCEIFCLRFALPKSVQNMQTKLTGTTGWLGTVGLMILWLWIRIKHEVLE